MEPHEKAWKACMQIIAWLRDHKHLGIKFTSNRNAHGLDTLVATSDASDTSNKGAGGLGNTVLCTICAKLLVFEF